VETLPLNHDPDIVDPPYDDNDLFLIADFERVNVFAHDRDGDDLFFRWDGVPSDVELEPDPPQELPYLEGETVWLSTYVVPRDPRLDGRNITVTVQDLDNAPVPVVWHVHVEE
jgi:hypothetical protein